MTKVLPTPTRRALAYARGRIPPPKRLLSPAERRRRQRIVAVLLQISAALLTLLAALGYVLFVGDNRWRAWYHHGVHLPSSARNIHCEGSTALPFNFMGGHSKARFTIDAAALPGFLSQFKEGMHVPGPGGGFMSVDKPNSPRAGQGGAVWGLSPTGRDYYGLTWTTSKDGVAIELDTDWN
jgi:hypothetical protein